MPLRRKKSATDWALASLTGPGLSVAIPIIAATRNRLNIGLARVSSFLVRRRSELAQQAPIAFDPVVDAGGPQRLPHDRLLRGHDVDAELLFDLLDRMRGRP